MNTRSVCCHWRPFSSSLESPFCSVFHQVFDPSIVNFGKWGASDVSLKAVCIAPDSDVDTMIVRYVDTAVASGFSQYILGVGSPLVGQVNAVPLPGTAIQMATDQLGRILFTTNRNFFGTIEEAFFNLDPLIAAGFVAKPKLKAIGYLDNPPTLPVTRTNYSGPAFHAFTTFASEIVARRPFYGRAVCDIEFFNSFGGGPYTIKINGWDFTGGPAAFTELASLVLPAAAFSSVSFQMQNRFFDAIEITATSASGPGSLLFTVMNFADAK
jgi:hypothetical protein